VGVQELDTQTQSTSQPIDNQQAAQPDSTASTSSQQTSNATDWQEVAELIANEIEKKQPAYETITADHGTFTGELRVVHQVTTGDLLVSFLLGLVIATHLVRWLFRAVWGR
jgi:hypothetical protein